MVASWKDPPTPKLALPCAPSEPLKVADAAEAEVVTTSELEPEVMLKLVGTEIENTEAPSPVTLNNARLTPPALAATAVPVIERTPAEVTLIVEVPELGFTMVPNARSVDLEMEIG